MADDLEGAGTSARVLHLLSLLQVRRAWPAAELAQRLTVSERTVRRYVDRLRGMGYEVEATTGPAGGYVLAAGTSLPPLVLDDGQAIAVTLALQTAAPEVEGVQDDAARALATIRQVLPERLRARVAPFDIVALGRRGRRSRPALSTGTLEAIGQAIRRRERLRFDYDRPGAHPTDPPERRELEATHVVTWGAKWFVVGWDVQRDDWRVFRVDRVRPVSPNGKRYTPRDVPGGVADFIASRFSNEAWLVRGTVRLETPAAEVVPWLGGADALVEPIDHGTCRLTAASWSWVALLGWFSMFDTPFTIEGPGELRDAAETLRDRLGGAT